MRDDRAPIRTVRIIARLNIGGPARHATLLDEGLGRLGYQTLLVYGVPGEGEGSLEHLASDRSLPVRKLGRLGPELRPWDDLRAFVDLLRVLRDAAPHVVHTHTAKAGALGRMAACAHNLRRPPSERCVIVHTFHGHVLHGYFSPIGSAAVRCAERLLAILSDAIVAIAPSQRDELVHRFRVAPADKVALVPLGLDLARMCEVGPSPEARTRLGLTPGAFVVLFVGRLVRIKNLPLLLEAFAALRRSVPAAELLIAGDGPLRLEVEERVRALGLSGVTHMLGWVEDLAPLFAAADAVVLTSDNEGTPVALIEAMAAARAVVATRAGGVVDLIEDGVTGRLVAPGHAEGVAAALAQLASDAPLRHALGRAARDLVRQRYAAERLVRDVDQLYRRLLERLGPAD